MTAKRDYLLVKYARSSDREKWGGNTCISLTYLMKQPCLVNRYLRAPKMDIKFTFGEKCTQFVGKVFQFNYLILQNYNVLKKKE